MHKHNSFNVKKFEFVSGFLSETAPRCQAYERVECGYFGIDKLQCWRKGCCYSPTTASGQSWCYHEKGKLRKDMDHVTTLIGSHMV